MRTLSLAMLLASGGLVACDGGGGDTEICDNGLDDNGDGVVDEGCEADAEICDNGTDDDGDGLTDCDDLVDCPEADNAQCADEICDDGVDNNEDGLVDCDDTATCGETFDCNPVELWSFGGTGTVVTGTSYTGTLIMTDEVVNNFNGTFENGDLLCEAHYTHNSTGAWTGTACSTSSDGCDWAFAMTDPALLDTSFNTTGYEQPAGTTYCTDWYDFTDSAADNYFGEVTWGEAFGYDSNYEYGGNTYTAAVSFDTDNGWGYSGIGTLTGDQFEWSVAIGYYAY